MDNILESIMILLVCISKFLSKEQGEVSEVNIIIAFSLFDDRHFPNYVAPPDFAKNTDMAQYFVYKMGLNFLRHFFV